MKTVVVWGPPCSGKTTYTREQMGEKDVVYDYDALKRAITNQEDNRVEQGPGHKYVLECRRAFLDVLGGDESPGTAYIITGRPSDQLTDRLAGMEDVEYRLMETSKQECMDRLAADDTRPDKDAWAGLIDKWFADQEEYKMLQVSGKTPQAEEVRSMHCERTAISRDGAFHTREVDGKRYIDGYFAVFGATYELWDNAIETVDPGAFDLGADTDVRALTNHDTTLVLGRTTAGTLTLRVDDRGLWGSIEINEADQDAVNQYERVKRRDVTQCSFGFDILDQRMEQRADGVTVWHLQRVKLYEVSVVTFPAYEATGVQARKAELEEINKRKSETWRAEMLAKLKGE